MTTYPAHFPAHDEQILDVNGIQLCTQTFGDPAAPTLLLIGGAEASMDWWADEFCQRLAAGGRNVVRYDTRDTGRSTTYPPGKPPYDADALVADALGILDELGSAIAHILGVSMGGGIAQQLVVEHPDRVASLTLMSTSPSGPSDSHLPPLPPTSPEGSQKLAARLDVPQWSDRESVISYYLDGERDFGGALPVDEAWVREVVGRAWDRSSSMASAQNHWQIDGAPIRDRLSEIRVPTLVLHGTADPLFAYGHGEALAREIPGARLVPLEGMGHGMAPREVWDVAISEILAISEAPPT